MEKVFPLLSEHFEKIGHVFFDVDVIFGQNLFQADKLKLLLKLK